MACHTQDKTLSLSQAQHPFNRRGDLTRQLPLRNGLKGRDMTAVPSPLSYKAAAQLRHATDSNPKPKATIQAYSTHRPSRRPPSHTSLLSTCCQDTTPAAWPRLLAHHRAARPPAPAPARPCPRLVTCAGSACAARRTAHPSCALARAPGWPTRRAWGAGSCSKRAAGGRRRPACLPAKKMHAELQVTSTCMHLWGQCEPHHRAQACSQLPA